MTRNAMASRAPFLGHTSRSESVGVYWRWVELPSQPGEGPHPEHPHRADSAAHALGDLVVRKPLDIAQEDDLGMIGRETRECICQAQLELLAAGSLTGRRAGRRERVSQATRRLGQRLLQRYFTVDIAPLGTAKSAHFVEQDMGKDLPQPGGQLGLGAPPKFRRVPHRLEHRLLHDVRRVELRPEPRLDLEAGEEAQPAPVALER
jgi:hypothetical protein